MSEAQATNLTSEQRTIVAKLRYMARQYTNGSYARGGSPTGKHYLDEAADAIEELAQKAAVPAGEVKPVGYQLSIEPSGGWHFTLNTKFAADEHVRAGGKARALYTTPPALIEGWRMVPVEPTETMLYAGLNADAFVPGNIHSYDDAEQVYLAMLAAAPQPGDKA